MKKYKSGAPKKFTLERFRINEPVAPAEVASNLLCLSI